MTSSFAEFEKRKQDHIRIALESESQFLQFSHFDKIKLQHCPLPDHNFSEIDISTTLFGHPLKSVHFISSMTAGHEQGRDVNLKLAKAASQAGWLMAVGSQRREIADREAAKEWMQIKKESADTLFLSNVGILEVLENSVEKIIELTKPIGSIGLIVHLNPLQEVFQNAEKANFKDAFKALEKLVREIKIPVIVKEVGFGISASWAQKFFDIGIQVVDVAGHGGTHWGYIEAARNKKSEFGTKTLSGFEDWGSSTVDSLLSAQELVDQQAFWASGGIRHGVHSAKCLALGARAVGIAQPLMKSVIEQNEDLSQVMKRFDDQLKLAIFCTGVRKWNELRNKGVWQCLKKD